jgi:hypothetical protein
MLSLFVFLPDQSYDRIAQIAIPFLFVIRLTRVRLLLLWLGSLIAAVAVHATVLGPKVAHLVRLPGFVQRTAGEYASLRDVAWANLLLVLVLTLFAIDLTRRLAARRGPVEARAALPHAGDAHHSASIPTQGQRLLGESGFLRRRGLSGLQTGRRARK